MEGQAQCRSAILKALEPGRGEWHCGAQFPNRGYEPIQFGTAGILGKAPLALDAGEQIPRTLGVKERDGIRKATRRPSGIFPAETIRNGRRYFSYE
jgi:hypothetical protein